MEARARDLAAAQEHLAGCATCTSNALAQTLLKSATARAGQRYVIPQELSAHLSQQIAKGTAEGEARPRPAPHRFVRGSASLGWATAALILVAATLSGSWFLMERSVRQKIALASADDALVSEAFDQHVASLAAATPEVLSSDNHTVKPWFQGKLPFAFNLPESLPDGMALDGANLTYLRNQPAAQLLFSIGRHRVSVFVMQRGSGMGGGLPPGAFWISRDELCDRRA